MGERKRYVLGFCFTEDSKEVVLMKKLRPAWQAGRFNGLGGKVEEGELPEAAMVREFEEEAGVVIPESDWDYFAKMESKSWVVYCFRCWTPKALQARTMEEEEVFIWPVLELPATILTNLTWLIPYALDHGRPGAPDCADWGTVLRIYYCDDHPDSPKGKST